MALFYPVTDIIWEDPPETALRAHQKPGRYKPVADALRQRKGEWARVPGEWRTEDSLKNTALNMRNGRVQGFAPKGSFEAAIDTSDGLKLYARYVGAPEPATPVDDTDELSDVEVEIGRGAMIRQWARAQGRDVPDRGRLKQSLVDEYNAEHQDHQERQERRE